MPYYKEVWRGGKVIEYRKYHSYKRPCKGERRSKKVKETCKAQAKINLRIATTKLRRLMNANFCDRDYLITLDYEVEKRPKDSKEMQEHMKEFLKKLRKIYKKNEAILKYIYAKERGKRGAAHIHMMLSRCGEKNIPDILKECWDKGRIHVDPLDTDGQYVKIANYFHKYASKTIETEGELIGKRYYPSKNLERPEPKKQLIRGVNTYYETIKEVPGYYLEKDSVVSGKTVDGYDYFSYTLHKIAEINTVRKRE